jgi:hypothetical protein
MDFNVPMTGFNKLSNLLLAKVLLQMLGFQKRGTKMTPLLKQYTPKGYTQHG